MLNESTLQGRVIAAALRLAGERPWGDVTLRQVAEAADTTLVELRPLFGSKGAILSAFSRSVDDDVLARAPKPGPDQPARDRIFDVVMTRFDVLAPYKAALKSIRNAGPGDLELLRRAFASQAWMLHAAGIGTDGMIGRVRVAGLGSVYASVLDTWLNDDDPSQARTMAALDRRLKRGEQAMNTLNDMCSAASRIAHRLGCAGARKVETPAPSPTSAPGGMSAS